MRARASFRHGLLQEATTPQPGDALEQNFGPVGQRQLLRSGNGGRRRQSARRLARREADEGHIVPQPLAGRCGGGEILDGYRRPIAAGEGI